MDALIGLGCSWFIALRTAAPVLIALRQAPCQHRLCPGCLMPSSGPPRRPYHQAAWGCCMRLSVLHYDLRRLQCLKATGSPPNSIRAQVPSSGVLLAQRL